MSPAGIWARWWPHLRASRIGRGTLTMQVGGGVQRGIAFLTHILLVRSLGAEDYGSYALVLSLVSLLPFLFDFGIRRTVITRYASWVDQDADREKARILAFAIKGSLWTIGLGVVLGAPLLLAVSQLVYARPELGQWAAILGISVLLRFPQTLAVALLEAGRHMGRVQGLELSAEVLRLLAVVGVLASGMGLGRLILGLAAGELATGALGLWALFAAKKRYPGLLPGREAMEEMRGRSLVRDYRPELRFGLMASGAKRSGQLVLIGVPLILGALAGARDVGILRIAWTLGSIPVWLMSAVSRNLLPALAQRRSRQDSRGFARILEASWIVGAALGLVSCGLLVLFGPWVVTTLYGDFVHDATGVLFGLLPYILVVGLSLAHESIYLVRDDLRALFVRSVSIALLTLAASPVVIGAHGALGAALTLSGGAVLAWLVDLRRIWGASARIDPDSSP